MILQYGMRRLFRTSPKLFALLGISLAGIIVLHQLSYITDLAFASPLPESIDLIKACRLPETETDPARDTQTRIASSIPKLVHQIWKTTDIHTYSTETSHESWKTSFEAMNYTIKLWAEDDIVRLINTQYPWLLPVNYFFMAERGSAFIQWTLEEAKRRSGSASSRILLPYLRVFWSTGPMMVTFAFVQYVCMRSLADHYLSVMQEQYGRPYRYTNSVVFYHIVSCCYWTCVRNVLTRPTEQGGCYEDKP
ncbi:uncharacterized protein NECHADRAFT_85278 [Fusarium vanettenii 77-13-4]|uniref:Uncharacterized protein n=1 Tax=Fusarium vanettenii (strain ATCC MYA-4622 / CBS 123669 / FGSC 9596 / NRRL 45880 / 77-13-4) TaxID=660122 RepID=C7YVH5_FUSV7|nr:uncharacterized protein NECHADRAFT_85278 [Fusarium vanettenii 77-13-4]EEU44978.1 hypothetical protein NECHADRAFT_85278 [Fusarium vanettenii 77-13-4]